VETIHTQAEAADTLVASAEAADTPGGLAEAHIAPAAEAAVEAHTVPALLPAAGRPAGLGPPRPLERLARHRLLAR